MISSVTSVSTFFCENNARITNVMVVLKVKGCVPLLCLPRGRSSVLLGVLTTGSELLCLPPRLKPVELVSTSDIIPGSSSNNMGFVGGG